ncbi:MAG: FtsX-like permease family protein [Cyanothece sp. SIO1E1]|nr:FtsX-like permease family protein [Cyanothece sp. SIO1E1]
MYRNYLKTAIRNLKKNRLHAYINIFGLAMGFVVAILSILYIKNELGFEKWIPEQEQIYRVYQQTHDQTEGGWVYSPSPLAATLAQELPGVAAATKVHLENDVLFTQEEDAFYLDKVAFVDSSFFKIFPFQFKAGDMGTALEEPKSIVISERVAKLFFGDTNPVGESLQYDGEEPYLIKGVLSDDMGNTFLKHDVYLSIDNKVPDHWLANRVTTYIKKEAQADIQQITQQTDELLFPIMKKEMLAANLPYESKSDIQKWKYQALADIHLHSEGIASFQASQGAVRKLFLFGVISFIVLLIASINYINLATAKGTRRAKEVGMRKVTGAQKHQLIGQFLTESILQSVIALGIAVALSELLLPVFNQISNRSLTFLDANVLSVIFPLLGLSVFIGLAAGIYPAFVLSQFNPIKAMKGNILGAAKGQFLRKALVVTQFSMTVILIIGLIFVHKQINFMQAQELGFDDEQVLSIEINKGDSWEKAERLQNKFAEIEGVKSMAFANNVPGNENTQYGIQLVGKTVNSSPDVLFTSEDFLETLGLELKEGRFFSSEFTTDAQEAYVVNEKFLKEYEIDTPIGQEMKFFSDQKYGRIVGVIKDFHFMGLEDQIKPLVMSAKTNLNSYAYAVFKISSADAFQTVEAIQKEWAKIEPEHPVRYAFLDETFAAQYKENENFRRTIVYATTLAIFIAMLGLFGLSSFMAEQRTKEIGVRKVLGASIPNLVVLLVKDFLLLVLIAGIIAIPFALVLVQKWLEDFAYTTSINALPFVLAIMGALALAVLTVSYQSIKVSAENPVKALKME